MTAAHLEALAFDGIGEVTSGTDLAAMVAALPLRSGDIVLVTSKVVSKAEGRTRTGTRDEALPDETVRVVARRGATSIVENHLGLVMAAAGIDASNVAPGTIVLLPVDPDASAREIRTRVYAETGHNVAVLVTDTAGRAWRTGQTDICIGVAGLDPVESLAGRDDPYGNPLQVTEPAVADELAGVAELVSGKLTGRPVAVVRGLEARVLAPGNHGPGARRLVRPAEEDLFGLGARQAVVAAVAGQDRTGFGAPAGEADLVQALADCGFGAALSGTVPDEGSLARVGVLAFAHGWECHADGSSYTLTPSGATP